MDSILKSIKKKIGLTTDQTDFDVDIIMEINTAFMVLNQLGVGPSKGFSIKDEYAVWTDFVSDEDELEGVKTYVYLKTKLVFDPPLSSAVIASMERSISEYEWRLNIKAESMKKTEV